jgi:hypothetical protein
MIISFPVLANKRTSSRWRIYLLRAKDQFLGSVEAADEEAARELTIEDFALRSISRPDFSSKGHLTKALAGVEAGSRRGPTRRTRR